jgi:tight adherence protein B
VNVTLLVVGASFLAFLAIVFLYFGWRSSTLSETQKRTRDQLRRLAMIGREDSVDPDILRDKRLSSINIVDQMLGGMPFAHKIEVTLYKAGMDMRVGTFMLISLVTAAGAMVLFNIFVGRPLVGLAVGLVCGFIPLVVVNNKKNKRMHLMDEQLPDSMDLMTSALRAGLSFPAALQLVAQEGPSPLAEEFGYTFDEQNLGMDIKEAMLNMARRIDSLDVKFFVTAVIVQRETGGNLAEIMDNIARIIRERFRILGDVRSLTAHGRYSGIILSLLPIAMGFIIAIIAPDYMLTFIRRPIGQVLLLAALFMQFIGFLWIRKIVNIRV